MEQNNYNLFNFCDLKLRLCQLSLKLKMVDSSYLGSVRFFQQRVKNIQRSKTSQFINIVTKMKLHQRAKSTNSGKSS